MQRAVKLSKSALKARATKQKILEAANSCFLEEGYVSTTIKDIALRAGVAPQTVYFVFGNKVSIVKNLLDVTIVGDDEPVALKDRPWVEEYREAGSKEQAISILTRIACEVTARATPLFQVLLRASSDPDVGALLRDNKRARRETMDFFADVLVESGFIHTEQQPHFTDVLYVIMSEECSGLFMDERGWSLEQWRAWCQATLLTATIAVVPTSVP